MKNGFWTSGEIGKQPQGGVKHLKKKGFFSPEMRLSRLKTGKKGGEEEILSVKTKKKHWK